MHDVLADRHVRVDAHSRSPIVAPAPIDDVRADHRARADARARRRSTTNGADRRRRRRARAVGSIAGERADARRRPRGRRRAARPRRQTRDRAASVRRIAHGADGHRVVGDDRRRARRRPASTRISGLARKVTSPGGVVEARDARDLNRAVALEAAPEPLGQLSQSHAADCCMVGAFRVPRFAFRVRFLRSRVSRSILAFDSRVRFSRVAFAASRLGVSRSRFHASSPTSHVLGAATLGIEHETWNAAPPEERETWNVEHETRNVERETPRPLLSPIEKRGESPKPQRPPIPAL